MDFVIEENVELPAPKAPDIDFKLNDLKPGQSFRIGKEIVSNARYACKQANRKQQVKGYRVTVETKLKDGESKEGLFRLHCIDWDKSLLPKEKVKETPVTTDNEKENSETEGETKE